MKARPFVVFALMLSAAAVTLGTTGSAGAATSIAVLDFVNRNPGDGSDWIGKGLADMVMTDLAASERLTVVDRQRVQEIAREMELARLGVLDETTAPQFGRIAKVTWLLFGTFSRQGDRLSIEAMLIDVGAGRLLRIEHIEGPLAQVFKLQQQLLGDVLARLDVPMTEEELRRTERLKTQSLPAFEHYSRSLALFDEGHWYNALEEARLARRADPQYLMAAARVAQLYHEVGEPEHALVEYRRLVALDRENSLGDEVYFRMAVVLDESMADRAEATAILERILQRAEEYHQPFHITDPPHPSRGWEEVGGKKGVDEIAEKNKVRLRTLARLANWQLQAGNDFEAATLRSRIRQFLCTHGMPLGNEALIFRLPSPKGQSGASYWRMVRENRDATLFPPGTLHLLKPDETVDPDTEPTHGYYRWQTDARVWLAPPDREIATIRYRAGQPAPKPSETAPKRQVQIDFTSPDGYQSQLFQILKVDPDGQWHELKLDPGIRAVQTYVFHTTQWQMQFALRPFVKPVHVPEIGGIDIRVSPDGAELLVNDQSKGRHEGLSMLRIPVGTYRIEARWPDGRRRSTTVELERGRRIQVFLNAENRFGPVSREILASPGSNPCLLTDRNGRAWLVWDQSSTGNIMSLNKESNLFCATSTDGTQWSRSRRLPVSSLGCDMAPILRQDRLGVFWLVWVSDRGPKAEKNVWIASSPNGIEWSFPRKIVLPEAIGKGLPGWREGRLPGIAFAIDARNVFWLAWQGWLMRSEDGVAWKVDGELLFREEKYVRVNRSETCYLCAAPDGRLLVAANRTGGYSGLALWSRTRGEAWTKLADLTNESHYGYHPGGVACRDDGTIFTITLDGSNLFVHQIDAAGKHTKPQLVESYLTQPFQPSITALPTGDLLAAFGTRDGLVATLLQNAAPATDAK